MLWLTVTERQALPSATPPPPHSHQRCFLMYEVRRNATLMKHLTMVMRDGVKES